MKGLMCLALAFHGLLLAESPDSTFESHTQRGIQFVYNLEFEAAQQEFSQLARLKPDHPAGHFFLAMVDWWRILIDLENEQYDDRFIEALDRVIDLCDAMLDRNENDITALFFKGGSLGFKGRLKFHRDDWFAAADAGRRALPLVQDASEVEPENYDIYLGTGIYNYYAAALPEIYPAAKPLMLFIPAGDKLRGIEQLKTAAERGRYAGVESTYFLMQIYYQFERNYPEALALATKLHARFPNNMLFHKYLGRCHAALGDWVNAEAVFDQIGLRAIAGQKGYNAITEREAAYYQGLARMLRGAYREAERAFLRCDELSRSLDVNEQSGFMVMANLKLGNVYDALARRDLALAQYNKVLEMDEYRDSHELSRHFLKNPYLR